MRVALGALDGDTHQALDSGLYTVFDGSRAEFLIGCPTLGICHRVPVECGGKTCVIRGTGDDVSGELKRYKLVVRDVTVEGINDPSAPWPKIGTEWIGTVASRIGIACEVQPRPRPLFSKVLGCKELIYDFLFGIW